MSWVIETHTINVDYKHSYHISYYWDKYDGYCVRVVMEDNSVSIFQKSYAKREDAKKSFKRQIRIIEKELEAHYLCM